MRSSWSLSLSIPNYDDKENDNGHDSPCNRSDSSGNGNYSSGGNDYSGGNDDGGDDD